LAREIDWSEAGVTAEDREESFVRRSVDGFKYMTSQVKVKKTGDLWKGLCPFHHERTPSFAVYPANARQSRGWASFYCYGCQKGGDVIQFAMYLHGLDNRRAAMKHLEKEFGLEYGDDEQLNELRLALRDEVDGPEHETVDLVTVNFTCSVAMRRFLESVKRDHPEMLDTMFTEMDRLAEYVDTQLRERTPAHAAKLPDEVFARLDELRGMICHG